MTRRLVDLRPEVSPNRLVAELAPPPRFAEVGFDTYVPDPAEPTQQAAQLGLRVFADRLTSAGGRRRGLLRRRAPAPPEQRSGVYLDGGFGVGKTHLLASLWHAAPAPKAFGTFVELTNLVGALGFAETVQALAGMRLLAIDEFELDDPGDTVLMSSLLSRLVGHGVALAATSNTLPDRLGEDRFAAQDFLREIQGLAAHFDVLRIEGEDYRHRGLPSPPRPWDATTLAQLAAEHDGRGTFDEWSGLVDHLASVHPSRYGAMVDDVDAVFLSDVTPIVDQASALRLVVLVDRLYDRDVPVHASGVPLTRVFAEDLLRGGYRKKYYRATSRLAALAREGREQVDEATPVGGD